MSIFLYIFEYTEKGKIRYVQLHNTYIKLDIHDIFWDKHLRLYMFIRYK
jgi:hypothetical protein